MLYEIAKPLWIYYRQKIVQQDLFSKFSIRGHSKTTLTKLYPLLIRPPPLSGQLWTFYRIPTLCLCDQAWTCYWPPTYLFCPHSYLKFGLSEKQPKFEKIFLNIKTMRKIFSNYVCFSNSPSFNAFSNYVDQIVPGFWPLTPLQVDNCGHFTYYLPFVDMTKHGLFTDLFLSM